MLNTLLKFSLLSFLALVIVQEDLADKPGLNDLGKQKLKGRVKSIMETRYTLEGKGKNATKDKTVYQKFTVFNEYGYESEVTLYKGGTIYLISSYNTDIDGKQLEMNEYNPDGTLNLSVSYKYDEKGFKVKGEYKWADSHSVGEICENTDYYYEIIQNDIFTKVIYKNDYRGLCLEENYLRSDSTLSFKIESKYDFRGNKLESSYYHGTGRLSWMTKNNFDRYDNMIGSRIFKSNYIAVQSVFEYQFDDTGNWTVRREDRDVYVNILTEGLEQADMITERNIDYY